MSKFSIHTFVDNLDVSSGIYRILLVVAALLVVLAFFLKSQYEYGPPEAFTDSVPAQNMQPQERYVFTAE